MWQRGVRARLRLRQGRWSEAEREAHSVLAAGQLPLGRIWPHLVLGILAARREAPPENPHLDELWRLTGGLGSPGTVAVAAAVLAEQAWLTRRPDPRLDRPSVATLLTAPFAGRDGSLAPLHRWLRRLAQADVQRVDVPAADDDTVPPDQPYERALASWDSGVEQDLLAALPVLDELGARAASALVRARLRASGVASVPRGRLAATPGQSRGTDRPQLSVLALLAEGMSNADIAARLVISRKTADHHVSAILTKLDVRTRGEAAAMARRLNVGSAPATA